MAQQFMKLHSALCCLFLQFFVEVPCSPLLFVPVLAFLPHSFYPTVDVDIVIRCLSSL